MQKVKLHKIEKGSYFTAFKIDTDRLITGTVSKSKTLEGVWIFKENGYRERTLLFNTLREIRNTLFCYMNEAKKD